MSSAEPSRLTTLACKKNERNFIFVCAAKFMDFQNSGSDAGALICAYDWSSTPLGTIESWPQWLRTTVNLLLRSPVPIVMFWGEDGIMLYNDAYSVFAGDRHPKLLGSKVREGWPEVVDFNDNLMRVGLAGGTLTYEEQELTLYRHGRAQKVSMDLNYSPVVDGTGAAAGLLCILADTTARVAAKRRLRIQRKRLTARGRAARALRELNETLERRVGERTAELIHAEESLRQAQKMEVVGQLTSGIAHDFNNMLAGITGSLELLQRRVAAGRFDGLERFASLAMASAQRATALTQRLLAFARRQPLEPTRVDVNRLLSGMEDLLRGSLGPGVELEMVLSGSLWPTVCDPNQLENAIFNLAINGCDAMLDGGRLTIETANSQLDEDYVHSTGSLIKAGQFVCIYVSDTGTGMSAEIIAKAFDPFFTTKPLGRGTGLGLSMLYGFVKQSGGCVEICSEPGKGTTVKLHLPRLCAAS